MSVLPVAEMSGVLQEDYTAFVQSIFQTPRVASLVQSLIIQATGHAKDPVAYVCVKLLSEPISISVVNGGLSMFKSDPTLIVPLVKLQKRELTLLRSMVKSALEDQCVVVREQRGGAQSLSILRPMNSQIKAPPAVILASVHHILRDFPSDADIINVVMQRLSCSTCVMAEDFRQAREIARTWPEHVR